MRLWTLVRIATLTLLWTATGAGADLSGPSYTARAGHVSGSGAAGLSSASFSAAGSLGQSEAVGLSGAGGDLTTSAPGFLPIVAGGLPHLDQDGDGVAYFLDSDDDGDGLADVVETNTGIFVSAGDTGTDSLRIDTDGDGVPDGDEIGAGSDPNDPKSIPGVAALPALNDLSRGVAILALTFASLRRLGATRRRRT